MILPTVYQEIRISSQIAFFDACVASQATCCSNSHLNPEPWRAQARRATTTPCCGQTTYRPRSTL